MLFHSVMILQSSTYSSTEMGIYWDLVWYVMFWLCRYSSAAAPSHFSWQCQESRRCSWSSCASAWNNSFRVHWIEVMIAYQNVNCTKTLRLGLNMVCRNLVYCLFIISLYFYICASFSIASNAEAGLRQSAFFFQASSLSSSHVLQFAAISSSWR